MKWWRCGRCALAFMHARNLVNHLMKVHGEPHFEDLWRKL